MKKLYLKVAVVAVVLLALVISVLSTMLIMKSISKAKPGPGFLPIFDGENDLKTANYHFFGLDQNSPQYPYLTAFQIKYPNSYYVTDYSTFNYFRTKGGGGFPVMVLTKGHQFTNPYETEDHAFQELQNSGVDCIEVRNYSLGDFEDTLETVNGSKIVNKENFKIGDYDVALRTMDKNFDAILKLPEDVFYQFTTCNLNNKNDLMTLLNSFQIRGTGENI